MKLFEQDFITLQSGLTTPKTKLLEAHSKSCVDSLSENDRNRRHLCRVFNDQDNEFDQSNLTNLDSNTVNRNLTLDEEVSKQNVDDGLDKNINLRFNQTLQN